MGLLHLRKQIEATVLSLKVEAALCIQMQGMVNDMKTDLKDKDSRISSLEEELRQKNANVHQLTQAHAKIKDELAKHTHVPGMEYEYDSQAVAIDEPPAKRKKSGSTPKSRQDGAGAKRPTIPKSRKHGTGAQRPMPGRLFNFEGQSSTSKVPIAFYRSAMPDDELKKLRRVFFAVP